MTNPLKRQRTSLAELKQALELRTRRAVETRLRADLQKLLKSDAPLTDSRYQITRYVEGVETAVLRDYLGNYDSGPTKALPEVHAIQAHVRDSVVRMLATYTTDPKKISNTNQHIQEYIEGYIQRHIAAVGKILCEKYLDNISAKYEITKLLDVDISELNGDTET